jgi:hypothetical protein
MTILGCGGIEKKSSPVAAKPQPDSRGLDPAIHAVSLALEPGICTYRTPWMPGSGPGMTIYGGISQYRCNRFC